MNYRKTVLIIQIFVLINILIPNLILAQTVDFGEQETSSYYISSNNLEKTSDVINTLTSPTIVISIFSIFVFLLVITAYLVTVGFLVYIFI